MTNLRVLILAALAISALSIDPDVYDQFERHAHGMERQVDAAHEAYNHYGRPADARNIRLIEQQLDELSEAYEAMIQHDHHVQEHMQEYEEQEHDQQQQDHEQQDHEQPEQELFNCFDLYDSNLGMRPWHDFRDCESEKPHCHEHGGEGGSHAITFDGDGEENVGKLTATRLQVGCAETCGTCDVMQEYLANQKSKEVTKGANHDTNVDTQRRQRGQELQMRERRQQQQEEVWRKQIVEHLQQLQRSNPVQALIAESALSVGSFRTWLEEAANVVVSRLAAAAIGGTDGTGSRKPNKHWMVVKQAIGLPLPPSGGGTNVAVPSKRHKQYEIEDQSISQHASRQQKQQRKREQRQQKQQKKQQNKQHKKQQQKKQHRKKHQQQMQQQKAAEQAAQHQRRQSRSERWEELRAQALRNEVVKESRRGERGVRGVRPEWPTKTGVGRREALARRGREMGLIVEDY